MQDQNLQNPNVLNEDLQNQYGFKHLSEDDKLLLDAKRSGIEKLQLFTRMLKRNNTIDTSIINHRKINN
jgi:hypothetical protein